MQTPVVSEADTLAAIARLSSSCEVAETRKTSTSGVIESLQTYSSSWWWQPIANPPSTNQSFCESAFAIAPISEIEEGSIDNDPALSDANPTPSKQSRALPPPASIMGCDANSPAMRRLAACLLCDEISAAQRIIVSSRPAIRGGKGSGGGLKAPQSNRTTSFPNGFSSSAPVSSAVSAAASTVSLLSDSSMRLGTAASGGGKMGLGGGVVSAGRGSATKLVIRLAANDLFASSSAAVGLVSLLRARNVVRHARRVPRNVAAGSLALKAVRAAEAEKNAEARELQDVDRLKRSALALAQFRMTIAILRTDRLTDLN